MQSNTHTLACLSSYFNLGFSRASLEIGERPFPFLREKLLDGVLKQAESDDSVNNKGEEDELS